MKQEPVPRLAVSVAQAAVMTTLSEDMVHREIKAGRLKAKRVGRRSMGSFGRQLDGKEKRLRSGVSQAVVSTVEIGCGGQI